MYIHIRVVCMCVCVDIIEKTCAVLRIKPTVTKKM